MVTFRAFHITIAAGMLTLAGVSPVSAACVVPEATGIVADGKLIVPDEEVTKRAHNWFRLLLAGRVNRQQLTPALNKVLSKETLLQISHEYGPLGKDRAFSFVEGRTFDGTSQYIYHATLQHGSINWLFSVNEAGKISSLLLFNRVEAARNGKSGKATAPLGARSDKRVNQVGGSTSDRYEREVLAAASVSPCP